MHLFYVSQCADVVLHDALINGHMGSHHRLVWFLKCQLLDYNSLVLHGLFKKKKYLSSSEEKIHIHLGLHEGE